jgi:hypothetical protein
MKIFTYTLLVLGGCLLISQPLAAQQQAPSAAKPRLFIECSNAALCNLDYIRSEISVTDFVRDRFQADIHIIAVSLPTGGNGEQHTLTLAGRGNYVFKTDTLLFYTAANATEDEKRQQLVRYIKLGLVPWLLHSSAASLIDVQYKNEPGMTATTAPTKDKWKSWAFTVGGRLFLSGDKNYNQHSIGLNATASKVTDKYKTSFSFFQNKPRNRYRYLEGGEKFELKTLNEYRDIRHNFIKSLSPKWSLGYEVAYTNSTYDNFAHVFSFSPGIEYNIYPYKQSSSKFLAIRYNLGADKRKYLEETIYNKKNEWLLSNMLGVYAAYTQKWGSINGSLSWYNYLHDVSKNNLSLYFELDIRVAKGLSLTWSTSASIINDQTNIAKAGADPQEILLQLKALSTSYNYNTSIGINYRFGSALNNIVNPRFTSGRM